MTEIVTVTKSTTPAEMLAGNDMLERRRARDIIAVRTHRGWDADRAMNEPVARARRQRTLLTVPKERKRGAVRARDGEALVDEETRYDDDDRAWYVTAVHPDGLSLDEIGVLLNVTRERIRQIEARALASLRRALEREGVDEHDIGAWISRRRQESDPDRNAPRSEPWVTSCEARDKPLTVEPYSEHGLRVEAACRELDATVERARARRDVARVVEGMEL